MKNENNIEFGDLTLREIGLDVNEDNHIVDEETGMPILMKGKFLKYNHGPAKRVTRDEINYDPLNNSKLMNMLFGYYSDKLESEGSRGIDMCASAITPNGKQVLKVKTGDDSIQSNPYYNESVRLMDVICKLNDSGEDVSKYDFKPEYMTKAKSRK